MKKYLLIAAVMALTSNMCAAITDSLSIGLAGGYSSYNTFRGEAYLKSDFKVGKLNTEMKFGVNNHSYQLTFDRVSDLNASSIGLFGDIALYPFGNGFFAGGRWEMITFNWFSEESKSKIRRERSYEPTSLYTGTNLFLQLGYKFEVSQVFGIKIYGQPGIQQFKVSNGSFSSGNYVIEDNYHFIYNVNLSVEFKIN